MTEKLTPSQNAPNRGPDPGRWLYAWFLTSSLAPLLCRPAYAANIWDKASEIMKGVKFQIWRGSDDTQTGEYNDLGTFYTDENGLIHLVRANTGWYKIQELEPAPGYTIKEPAIQEIYLEAGKDHTVTFENTPKNAIVVEKARFVP